MAVQRDGTKKSSSNKGDVVEPFYHRMLQLYRRAFDRQRLKDKLAAMTVLLKKGVAAQGGSVLLAEAEINGGDDPGLDEDD